MPAESVYAVFECKPALNKDLLLYGSGKADSVRKLHRTGPPCDFSHTTFTYAWNIPSAMVVVLVGPRR